MTEGYFLPQYNYSVEMYQGQWVCVARQTSHIEATTPDAIQAIHEWASRNRGKFMVTATTRRGWRKW
jgi:hypothetical protein